MAYLTSRLIISHVTDTAFTGTRGILLPLQALLFNTYLPWLLCTALGAERAAAWHVPTQPLLPSAFCLHAYLALVIVVYAHYVVSVVNEITTFLNIRCFVIKPSAA